MAGKRTPRFKRVRTRNFRLTARDREIIHAVYQYRLLDSDHIALLAGGSPQGIRRRLQLLYHNRFLDRPIVQVANYHQDPRSTPFVYALGNKGADLLSETLDLPRRKIDWTTKNRKLRDTFFRHTLMVAGIMVAFEVSCKRNRDVRVIPWDEILETKCPPETRRRDRPQTWQVRIDGGRRLGITPDAIFGLHFTERPEGRNRMFFFLEADRGTMPVERRSLTQSGIYKKLLTYHATAVQGLHTRRFGIKTFRVLTVTESKERRRLESMVAATKRLRGLQSCFLFTDMASLSLDDALTHSWVTGNGGTVVLREG